MEDISGEIEKLINNYSSKKKGKKSNMDNFADGLKKLKEINKDAQNFENDLNKIMNVIFK